MNNRKIDITGQTNATVKTNKETIELPLLITKAKTLPLSGLAWMQRLKFNLSSRNEAVQFHNIKLDMEKKIIKLQNDFNDLFYNNRELKNFSVKVNLKDGAQIIQQKARPIPKHLQNQVALELRTADKIRILRNLERATEITEDCFLNPAIITVKKDKSIKLPSIPESSTKSQ